MKTYCGTKCNECGFKSECKGCEATLGKPFGGSCIAAEYIKFGGREAYELFKVKLINEINAFLNANDIPSAEYLCEKIPSENINDSDYTCEIWIAVNEK